MTYQPGLAAKAIRENLQALGPSIRDPERHNLYAALLQIAEGLDQLVEEQGRLRRLLERR